MATAHYASEYEKSMILDRREKIRGELETLIETYKFDRQQVSLVGDYYTSQFNAKLGDVLKVTQFVFGVLEAIDYGESHDDRCNFVCKNKRIVLDSYDNFRVRLSVFSHFGFLKEAILSNYICLGYESNITAHDLYALLSSGIKFDSLSELMDIYDRMTLEDRRTLKLKYPLTGEIQAELYTEMMESINRMIKRNSFRKQLEQRRAAKRGNE